MPKNLKYLQTSQLDNGLRVLLHPNPTSPSVSVVVLFGVGSRYEDAKNSGISHFLEHMAFKGTDLHPSTLDIAMAVDNVGGESNAFTSKEYTGYYIKVAAKDLTMAIGLLEDMLFHSKYAEEECDRERNVIVEEINMYRDSPRDVVGEMYEQLLFPNQPLGMEVTGSPQSLAQIDHQKIRQFNQDWYVPGNMVVAISGQFDQDQIHQQLEGAFGSLQNKKFGNYLPAQHQQSQPQVAAKIKDTDQTQLIVGWRGYGLGHPNRYALALLNIILGGNMSSRLFTEVRERRGLAYAVSTSIDDYLDAGSINCSAGLSHAKTTEALRVIIEQFQLIKDQGVTATELQHAKQYLRGRLALSMEDGLGASIFHGRQWLLEDKVTTIEDILDQVDQVTLEQTKMVANELFIPSGLNVAAIGPQVDESALLACLK